jgi:hypothetical protein
MAGADLYFWLEVLFFVAWPADRSNSELLALFIYWLGRTSPSNDAAL